MITPGETARILGKISICDKRTIGEADVHAWTEILNLANPPIEYADAINAVAIWHAENADGMIRPAHVIQGAQRIARRRAGAKRALQLAEQTAIEASPAVRTARDEELLAELRSRLGTGNRDVLRRREWVEHERMTRRDRTATPNPLFQGFPPTGGHPTPDDTDPATRQETP